MTRFMQRAHEGRDEIVLAVSGGDAHVILHTAAEGMKRDIEAAMVKIKSDDVHELAAERLLCFERERPSRANGCRALGLLGQRRLAQSRQK